MKALHNLRSVAHIVDMHQLTKDPSHQLVTIINTESSPVRILTREELTRYLDYCTEILSLNAKIGALFAQNVDDPIVLNAVNDLARPSVVLVLAVKFVADANTYRKTIQRGLHNDGGCQARFQAGGVLGHIKRRLDADRDRAETLLGRCLAGRTKQENP